MSVDEFRQQFAEAAGSNEQPDEETTPVEQTDTVAEPEQPTEPAAEEESGEPLLAGKYKTVEELEKAYLEEQQLLGRQGEELGNLRQLSEQMGELAGRIPEPQPDRGYDPGSLDDYLALNPHQIPQLAQRALETNDQTLYPKAMAAWSEIDPMGALDFHARAVSRAEMAQLRAEMAPALQGMQQVQVRNDFEAAYETKAAQHDDFAQVMSAITDENIADFPKEVLAVLQTGDQASKEQVLETLYRWTKAEQAGNLTVAAGEAARQAQQDSRQARADARVATPSGSQSREPATGVDLWREQFQNSDAFRKAAGLI